MKIDDRSEKTRENPFDRLTVFRLSLVLTHRTLCTPSTHLMWITNWLFIIFVCSNSMYGCSFASLLSHIARCSLLQYSFDWSTALLLSSLDDLPYPRSEVRGSNTRAGVHIPNCHYFSDLSASSLRLSSSLRCVDLKRGLVFVNWRFPLVHHSNLLSEEEEESINLNDQFNNWDIGCMIHSRHDGCGHVCRRRDTKDIFIREFDDSKLLPPS